MTDTGTPGKKQEQQPPLVISGQYIRDLSFEAPKTPEIFSKIGTNPNVQVDLDADARKLQDKVYDVTVKLTVNASFDGEVGFILELAYAAIAIVNVAPEHEEPAVMIETPRMMFPFMRAIVADITRDSGFPALLLQQPDFGEIYNQKKGASA